MPGREGASEPATRGAARATPRREGPGGGPTARAPIPVDCARGGGGGGLGRR